ncbi:MAG TPA: hypothetical protein VFI73_11915 [Candidatus Nitrosopolaris sp.]|nr:hypothetical protein [Candidatus Nitrosopolaris sp.]
MKKDKFWIPKYVANAYDGKTLWLLINEEEILGKYHHGSESPPADEQYASQFEAFKTTPYDRKPNIDMTETKLLESSKIIRTFEI